MSERVRCPKCHGSKIFEPGDGEIYRCPECGGIGEVKKDSETESSQDAKEAT